MSSRTAASAELATRNEEIKQAHKSGLTYRQISEQFNLTPLRVKDIIRDPYSAIPPESKDLQFEGVIPEEETLARNRQMKELREQGGTLDQIGKIFNVTRERVRQIVSDPKSDQPKPEKAPKPQALPVGRPRKKAPAKVSVPAKATKVAKSAKPPRKRAASRA